MKKLKIENEEATRQARKQVDQAELRIETLKEKLRGRGGRTGGGSLLQTAGGIGDGEDVGVGFSDHHIDFDREIQSIRDMQQRFF